MVLHAEVDHSETSLAAKEASPAGSARPDLRWGSRLNVLALDGFVNGGTSTHVEPSVVGFFPFKSSNLPSIYLSISSAAANGRRPRTKRGKERARRGISISHASELHSRGDDSRFLISSRVITSFLSKSWATFSTSAFFSVKSAFVLV
jgi:hypothetical protein